MRNSLDTSKKT